MVIFAFSDKTYIHTIRWLRDLSNTLSNHQKIEMLEVIAEFSTCIVPCAVLFDGMKFERFLERLEDHPSAEFMKGLLDDARITRVDGEAKPF